MLREVDDGIYEYLTRPNQISVGMEVLSGVKITELYLNGSFKTDVKIQLPQERVLLVNGYFIIRGNLWGQYFVAPLEYSVGGIVAKVEGVLLDESGDPTNPQRIFHLHSILYHERMFIWAEQI